MILKRECMINMNILDLSKLAVTQASQKGTYNKKILLISLNQLTNHLDFNLNYFLKTILDRKTVLNQMSNTR